ATEIRIRIHKLTAAKMLNQLATKFEEGRFKRQDAGRFTTESTTLEEAAVEGNIALAKQVVRKRPEGLYIVNAKGLFPVRLSVVYVKRRSKFEILVMCLTNRLFREPLASKNLKPLALTEFISEELAFVLVQLWQTCTTVVSILVSLAFATLVTIPDGSSAMARAFLDCTYTMCKTTMARGILPPKENNTTLAWLNPHRKSQTDTLKTTKVASDKVQTNLPLWG
ncbi:hypothetical protein Tco_0309262, partial [Tanacetum coccineum]